MGLHIGRAPGQGIVFPSAGIELTLEEVRKGRARLQVEAAESVPVLRRELLDGGAVRGRRERRPASYRVVYARLDLGGVGITTAGPWWTCQAAARQIRGAWRNVLVEVVIDGAGAEEVAAQCSAIELTAAAAGCLSDRAPGGRALMRVAEVWNSSADVYAAWLQLAARLGAV